jgi:UDP-N-acetyl-D-mannosaminouronate:lipid I N-acetyl-D-mannosaminouronosyltransferase
MSTVPSYRIRSVDVLGFRDENEFIAELFAGDTVKTGVMVAINAEKIIISERDPVLRTVIDTARYRYADGISIVRSIRKRYSANVERIAGVDLWQSMMRRAGQDRIPVFLLGGRPEVLNIVQQRLKNEWQVEVVGSQDGYFDDSERPTLFKRIRDSEADVVTVALGSPKQELFIHDCSQLHPDALYMGVGGTFDIFSGHVKRAPELWRKLELEWLYRMLSQPTRLDRLCRVVRYASYHYSNRL